MTAAARSAEASRPFTPIRRRPGTTGLTQRILDYFRDAPPRHEAFAGDVAKALGVPSGNVAPILTDYAARGYFVCCTVLDGNRERTKYRLSASAAVALEQPHAKPAPYVPAAAPPLRPGAGDAARVPSLVGNKAGLRARRAGPIVIDNPLVAPTTSHASAVPPEPPAEAPPTFPAVADVAADAPSSPAPPPPPAAGTLADRVRAIFRAAAAPLTMSEAADLLPGDHRPAISQCIHMLRLQQELVAVGAKAIKRGRFHSNMNTFKWNRPRPGDATEVREIPVHAIAPASAVPAPATQAEFRCALFSDGSLLLQFDDITAARWEQGYLQLHLSAANTRQLIDYLDRIFLEDRK